MKAEDVVQSVINHFSLAYFETLEAKPLNVAALKRALAAVAPLIQRAERENSWQPISTAPQDRAVEVYAPPPDPARWHPTVHDLAPIVCLAQWHPDAGFCVCTIREVTHWREHVPPPSAR